MFTAIVKWLQYFPTLLTPEAETDFFFFGISRNGSEYFDFFFFSVCVLNLSTGLWFNNLIALFCAIGPVTW